MLSKKNKVVKIDDWLTGDVVPIRKVPVRYRDDYENTLRKVAEAARETGKKVYLSDSFRFKKDQEARWRTYMNGGPIAAKPGTSDHERGLSVDIPNARGNRKLMKALKKRGMIDDVKSEQWHITNTIRKYGK
jgi:D-alanyl-D-alanine dipeptidase